MYETLWMLANTCSIVVLLWGYGGGVEVIPKEVLALEIVGSGNLYYSCAFIRGSWAGVSFNFFGEVMIFEW